MLDLLDFNIKAYLKTIFRYIISLIPSSKPKIKKAYSAFPI